MELTKEEQEYLDAPSPERKTYTKGNVIVEDIKMGDIHYEFEHGCCIKCEVLTQPKLESEDKENGKYWTWQSKKLNDGAIINYAASSKYSHYGPNLYNYEAYKNCKMI